MLPNDAGKRLSVDMEGRPLVADEGRIAGRRTVGGSEEAVSPQEFDAIATQAAGGPAETIAKNDKRLQSGVGSVYVDKYTGELKEIYLSRELTPEKHDLVYGHELGHVIDQIAGEIPVNGILEKELKPLYNTLNNPNRNGAEAANWGKTFRPDDSGYRDKDIPREYMTEAVRAYISNPNYIKTGAPKMAARSLSNQRNPALRDRMHPIACLVARPVAVRPIVIRSAPPPAQAAPPPHHRG